jgi:hypothetical protein
MNTDVRCRVSPLRRTCAQPRRAVKRTADRIGKWYISRCYTKAPRGTVDARTEKERA